LQTHTWRSLNKGINFFFTASFYLIRTLNEMLGSNEVISQSVSCFGNSSAFLSLNEMMTLFGYVLGGATFLVWETDVNLIIITVASAFVVTNFRMKCPLAFIFFLLFAAISGERVMHVICFRIVCVTTSHCYRRSHIFRFRLRSGSNISGTGSEVFSNLKFLCYASDHSKLLRMSQWILRRKWNDLWNAKPARWWLFIKHIQLPVGSYAAQRFLIW